MWPNLKAGADGVHRLKQTVLELRRAVEGRRPLGADWKYIVESTGTYYFNADSPYYSDFEDFQHQLALARAAHQHRDVDTALARFRLGLELYQGELLPEFRYEDWTATWSAAMRALYLAALDQAAGLYASRGQYTQAVDLLGRAIREDPLRESSYLHLMECRWQEGKHVEALRTYLQLQDVLAKQLHLEPMPEARALYNAIRQDRASASAMSRNDSP